MSKNTNNNNKQSPSVHQSSSHPQAKNFKKSRLDPKFSTPSSKNPMNKSFSGYGSSDYLNSSLNSSFCSSISVKTPKHPKENQYKDRISAIMNDSSVLKFYAKSGNYKMLERREKDLVKKLVKKIKGNSKVKMNQSCIG